jgi:acyl-CoA thioester hydrolase
VKVKIHYHHTDCGGVVYYARYLDFLEEARTEYLESRGLMITELAKEGILFVVARQEIDYKLPAFYADTLQVNTRVVNVSGVKIEFEYDIVNQHKQVVTEAKTLLVCIGKDFKPQPIPAPMRKKIAEGKAGDS